MEEVDVENADDLSELEARLYAQIHHEPSGACDFAATYKEPSVVRQVTSNSVINNKSIDKTPGCRYWKDKRNAPPMPIKSTTAEIAHDEIQLVPAVAGKEKAQPAETIDKSFQPPVKNLSNLRVNPFASGNGPKAKGSTTKTLGKVAPVAKAKNNSSNKGPFARQMTKLAHAAKYDAKKQKAKAARGKESTARVVERIELMSSNESEIDDVIEVPLPSPQILTVDSSSDDEREAQCDDNFLKPQSSMIKENSSRCTSPCSVMSDDFIGQSDRCRLQEEDNIPDDEDLLTLQEDVDSLMENPNKSTDKSSDTTTLPLLGDIVNRSTDYRVTQSEFRALDVYESESDIQESVYLKGTNVRKPSIVVNLDKESSSESDVEAACSTQKTKRLRKRRASSTNKEAVSFIDSTDSERENENGNDLNKSREGVVRTRIPFIARGEALEEYVSRDSLQKRGVVNSSDNEFIATLNTLVQGTNTQKANGSDSETNDEMDEQITARAIAEQVVQKESRIVESAHSAIDCGDDETNEHGELQDTTGDTSVEPVMVDNDNANDAVPTDSINGLDNVFEKIDSINEKSLNVDDSEDSNHSVRLVAPLPVPREIVLKQSMVKPVKNTGDPVYNIVYCEQSHHLCGIGWNEEMQRFYNDSWKGENFSVKAICSRMKTTKSLWKIYSDDRFPRYRKHSNQKCLNCCEYGHIRARCPKPRKEPVCYMCGEKGHREPRCPNTVCLRCGNKTRMFTKSCNACNYQNRLICPICKVRGHSLNLCPDKWRRYHSTTNANEYPYNKVEYKNRKFCCVCGCRGHLAEHCRNAVRFMEYPMFVSEIRSHQKSYDDLSIKSMPTGIGYNLMYKPDDTVTFELAENKTQHQYYGRFLLAVGMGHLLKRKRKAEVKADSESTPKQPKVDKVFKEYVVNPFAKAALDKPANLKSAIENSINIDDESEEDSSLPTTSGVQRNDPPMMSETSIKTEAHDDKFIAPNAESPKGAPSVPVALPVDDLSEVESSQSTFKTPDVASITDQPLSNTEVMEVLDSDSNYSFSEHFELAKQKTTVPKAREMEPLPDFIPITDDGDVSSSEENVGISKPFVSADTDDENTSSMPDIPCEAKIYLTNFHSKFLLSPEGNKFLVERSKAVNIKSRLDWTSVGHILIIFGLRVNQDKFHAELLHKFRELSDKLNRKQLENSQKVPRKTEVLIRFLREHLNQLHANLGNVNELIKRLHMQENQHTKSGWKSAEKTRRSLNMILIGQAGLRNGSKHLDVLLTHLRTLLDDFKEDVVPDEMRDEIDSHWKLIFSSYRHENYADLVDGYNLLQNKNRLQNTPIDPRLLGKNMLDTTLTKAQKDKLEKGAGTMATNSETDKQRTLPKTVPNPFTPRNQVRQQKTPISEKKRFKNVSANLTSAAQNSPNTKKQQKPGTLVNSSVANKIRAVDAELETKCANLLTEINDTGKIKKGAPQRDSKAPSMFWSREALKYIDECMQLGKSNASLMEKMSRVQKKSQQGMLSYNDYRAIIKIHNAVKGKH